MPRLESARETTEVVLPKTGGRVKLYSWLLASEDLEIEKLYTSGRSASLNPMTETVENMEFDIDENYYHAMDRTLEIVIADWDLENADGSKAEITSENIKKLPAADFNLLSERIDEVVKAGKGKKAEAKKKS